MQASQNGLERIKNCKKDLVFYMENPIENESVSDTEEQKKMLERFRIDFEKAMDDDFNTADAVTAIYELVRYANVTMKESPSKEFAKAALDMLQLLCSVLGLLEEEEAEEKDAAVIEELIAKRSEAKKRKDFAEADAIRDQLSAMGIVIKDTRQGVQWYRG